MSRSSVAVPLLALGLALGSPAAAQAQNVTVKMGTMAPEGSPWHDTLMQMRQDWRDITGGEVDLKIYPSGVQGDEHAMIRKMSFRRLQAVAITGAGLSRVEPAVACLQIPLMFSSYPELDYVVERMAPRLQKMIESRGYIVLNWGDAGWVHFFTKTPVSTLDEIRGLKLLTAAGDPETEELYKDFGFRVVPLSYTDVLSSLQTGLIEAVQGPPLYAMIQQWFGLATNMVDIKWAALVGATVIRKDTWEQIPAAHRPRLLAAAQAAGQEMRAEIRKLGDDAVPEMKKRGLNVVAVDPEARAAWRREADEAYPRLKGTYVSAELFDEVMRLRNEYRNGAGRGARAPGPDVPAVAAAPPRAAPAAAGEGSPAP